MLSIGTKWKKTFALVCVLLFIMVLTVPIALADHPDDGLDDDDGVLHHRDDPSKELMEHDAATAGMHVYPKTYIDEWNLTLVGRGPRLLPGATTDVWALDGFAYIGTFQSPCGDGTGANGSGIRIFDVRDLPDDDGGPLPVNAPEVGVIPSVLGSRSNDVKVAEMDSGDILVHSNEDCSGSGPGGFEIWNVDDPLNPVHLAHVQTDDINAVLRNSFGVVDVGVHNVFLFTQDDQDYVAVNAESFFGNFQIFNISAPATPTLVGAWGAEELCTLPQCSTNPQTETNIGVILDTIFDWMFDGYGASQNRFLHDITISDDDDATRAYLSNWDAGLVLLDISNPASPLLVSVALDVVNGSLDGEVNSHAAWPSEDGDVVVEGEEDFAPFQIQFTIDPPSVNAGPYPSAEGTITVPIVSLPGQTMTGPTRYVGYGCQGSVFSPPAPFNLPMPLAQSPNEIALIQRGACFFSEKINNAQAAGYAGGVVFNDAAGGNALVTMGGVPVNLPGVFVGHSTGLAIMNVLTAAALPFGGPGANITASAIPNGWGGVRIWDYSNPSNPVLVSTFNTVCSANPTDPSCDPRGTYTAHNVIVDDDKAYLSWYADGVLVLDIDNPSNPVEIARYHQTGPAFETQNGGIQDVWGIYKDDDLIYASDRNGGLYVFTEGDIDGD